MDIGHSSLLKFLVKDTMSEKNIESKVPGEQNIREVTDGELDTAKESLMPEDKAHSSTNVNTDTQNQSLSEENTSEIASAEDFTFSPVITVTKKEATFTKGEMKLQKVTVTEDISHTSVNNEGGEEKFNRRLTYEIHSSMTQPESEAKVSKKEDGNDYHHTAKEAKELMDPKRLKTKIPMSRLRQVVNRVKNDIKEKKRLEKENGILSSSRKSSIPRLKESKIPSPKETHVIKKEENVVSVKADEEFDRIFQDLSPTDDTSLDFINTGIENLNQIENSFEEIIHAYEENKVTQTNNNTDKVRQSRIPLLKRRSEHEIEVPKSKEKTTLKKSNSVDTSKVQSSLKHEEMSEQRKFVSEQTRQIHTQTKVTSERYVLRKENINDVTSDKMVINSNTSKDTVVIDKVGTVFHQSDAQIQESSLNEVKEVVKVAIPAFDIAKSEDKLRRNELIDDTEDLTQEITISKNLNFDKETVSKIYKIDFTENNFDSLDIIDKSALLNEITQRDQMLDVKNDNRESTNVKIGTNEVSQTTEFETNTKRTETSIKSMKINERMDYNENIELGNIQTTVRQVSLEGNKTKHTKANNISAETLMQSITTNNKSDNIAFSNQFSVKKNSVEANKTTETKISNISSEIVSVQTSEKSENVTFDNIRHVSLEGNITNKAEANKIQCSSSVQTSIQSVKTSAVNKNTKQELMTNSKNIEFDTNEEIVREVVSLEGIKITEVKERSVASIQSVKTSERSENANRDHMIDKRGSIKFDDISSSTKKASLSAKTIDKNANMISVETSIQSLKTSERNDVRKRYQLLDKNEIKDVLLEANKTNDTITDTVNEDTAIKPGASDRYRNAKLDRLVRRYETFELDEVAFVKNISLEAHKAKENKASSNTIKTFENSVKANVSSELKTQTAINTNKGYSKKSIDMNKSTETSDEITTAKLQYQHLNKDDSNESVPSISPSANIENIAKGTVTKSINNSTKSSVTEVISSNSRLSQQIIGTSNNITASTGSLDKTENSFITRNATNHRNINIQNSEDTYKIYSEVFTKINAAQNKQTYGITKETDEEVKQISNTFDNNKNNIQDIETTREEDILILRGKVNRVVRRISSIDNTKPVEKNAKDLPKKKSILSRIEMFERGEPDEIYPKPRIQKIENKATRIPQTLRQTSTELRRPKIVREVFKQTYENQTEATGNTAFRQFESIQQERTDKIRTIRDENSVSNDTKLKDVKSEKYSVTGTKLSTSNYKRVRDVAEEINKVTEVNSIRNEKEIIEKTSQDTADSDLRLSTQTSSDKTILETKQTEENKEKQYDKQNGSQSLQTNDVEIRSKGESSKLYTKIYTNTDSEKTVRKYASSSTTNLEDFQTTDNTNKTAGDDVFNFTPMGKSFKDMSEDNKQIYTSRFINIENNIESDSKAKSLEFIPRQNCEMTSKKSYESLENDYKESRRKEFDIRRTTSVAELELGGVIKGRVHEIIMRINSMEMLSQGKKEVGQKEQPRKSSVSEKIALFEGKLPPVKTEKRKESTYKMKKEAEVSVEKEEEEIAKKIAELNNVKNNYDVVRPEYLELRDGSEMPVIALGTASLDQRLIKHVVEAAIEMGYRAIDTAYIYGNEKEIGEAINNKINDGTVKREDLYIISKLWSTYHRRDLVEKACRQSLDNMGLTYFDLYLIHNPMSLLEGDDPMPKIANVLQYSQHDYMEAWSGIEDLVLKGLVKRGGVSNFNSEQVHRVMEKGRLKPVVNQVECHPYLSQERLGGFCDAYGMRLSCYGVLGSKGTPAEHKSDLPPVIDDPLVLVMAAGLGVSPGQMLISYQLHNGRSVVIKATSAAHLYDDLKAQFISLESSHLTALKSLNKNKRTYYLKGLGETHKNYPFNIAF